MVNSSKWLKHASADEDYNSTKCGKERSEVGLGEQSIDQCPASQVRAEMFIPNNSVKQYRCNKC
jgi:hypothetical protein